MCIYHIVVVVVVVVFIRELAFQIAEQFRALGKNINLKDAVIVGGVGN
jgi:ATP-dependent RNA helicase DDX49/DBP8